jgi:hypothetical protein
VLIYGRDIVKLCSGSRWHPKRFYLLEPDFKILQWISPKKAVDKTRVNLAQVNRICFGTNNGKFLKKKAKFSKCEAFCASIFITGDKETCLDVII